MRYAPCTVFGKHAKTVMASGGQLAGLVHGAFVGPTAERNDAV
jgi:hypothetical protein